MFHGEAVDSRTNQPDAVIWSAPYGILVNRHGRRFMDEGSHTLDRTFELVGYEIWRNQDQEAYWISDQNVADLGLLALNFTDQPPVEAATVGELAEKLGLDREALEKTVAEFNAACGPEAFDHTRLDGKSTTGLTPRKSNWAQPLSPFVGYPLTTAITFTFGGLRTDLRGRVLTPGGTPIAGLYAAGEVTGLFYHEYPTATSVLRSVTFGRIAGAQRRHAAAVVDSAVAQPASGRSRTVPAGARAGTGRNAVASTWTGTNGRRHGSAWRTPASSRPFRW